MTSRPIQLLLVLFLINVVLASYLGSSLGVEGEPKLTIRCKEAERRALLNIKDHLYSFSSSKHEDIDIHLSSWGEEQGKRECCEWIGIRCDSKSGHVTKLDLSASTFHMNGSNTDLAGNNISSSLAHLHYLNYLDLSGIHFGKSSIPSFIGDLTKLRYLNLSDTHLSGEVPPQLGNLSTLQFLDLNNEFGSLTIKNLGWVSHLSSLQLLDLSHTNMSLAHDWGHVFNNLPHLTSLLLSHCDLPNITNLPPSVDSLVNSSSKLSTLDLSYNSLSSSIFQWLFKYTSSLVYLNLYECSIQGLIPNFFGNMTEITYLNLKRNLLEGSIPESFGTNMTSIEYLDLGENRLEGSIPKSFGNMTSLEYLNLGYNRLQGEIPKSIWEICTLQKFQANSNNLGKQIQLVESSSRCANFSLEYLDLSLNQISGPLPNFTLYPSLIELRLRSNQLNGNVSKSIGQLSQLTTLDISRNSIQCVMLEAHFSKLSSLLYLDLSYNTGIVFNIPSDWIAPFQLHSILLGSCKLGPQFPKWLESQQSYTDLNISNSGISDSIPDLFWTNLPPGSESLDLSNNKIKGKIHDKKLDNLSGLIIDPIIDLSSNQLEGSIPLFLLQVKALNLFENKFSKLNAICNVTNSMLRFLDVSYNQLEGELPDCWSNMKNLQVLDLANNKLIGKIPNSIDGSLYRINTLHLSNNNLSGELPSSLQSCTKLMVLNVGGNKLWGPIPTWIGKSLTELVILSLRSNNFYGSIPSQLCHLKDVQVLDLSSNNLSSYIPTCLHNITAMKENESALPKIELILHEYMIFPGFLENYKDKLFLVWKGAMSEIRNLNLLKTIDLSSNKLIGEIPKQVTELIRLVSLNLSRNNLSGQIPQEIGRLKSLDVLDLSKNQLSGPIPWSLSQVDRLNTLDLSSNNLSGKIPTGTQLQMRDATAYMGNPELCGDPLPQKCLDEEEPTADRQKDQDEFITKGFYVSIGLGFVVGFWGVCLTLIFNNSFRYGYFKLLNKAEDWIYLVVAVHKAKLLRIIKS